MRAPCVGHLPHRRQFLRAEVLPMTQPTPCPILDLNLGPLDLNLLGLHVHLNEVVLDVEAIPGPGNLLGNLLCAIAGLLDGVDLGGVLGNLLQELIDALIRLLEGIGGGGGGGGGTAPVAQQAAA
ncbi:hypothetical protein GCM10027261_00710 [Geodermatophilus arenarius]